MADAGCWRGRAGTPPLVALVGSLNALARRWPDWRWQSPVHPGFLAVALLMLALQAGGATIADALRYERSAIASGEVWRLVSGHFVHLGWTHCLLNVGGVVALAAILPAPLRAWRCCLLLATIIGLALFATLPSLQHYAGFSGVNYGLAALALLPRARAEATAALVLGALIVRALWQWLGGGGAADAAWLGAPPLAAAHLAGLASGAAILFLPLMRLDRLPVGPATRSELVTQPHRNAEH
ncbi:rhombosortase [Cupriavidus metallidurans]|uniref:rhombosortase n=1 Tax=Cupriavidus metallidurans TaxID=119219 RepID=UPI000037C1F6|nr:rhombosortase [Cupriavidus metallidurans]UBM08332.1 rhombosortase [Cupriavidus metallidurans]